MSFRDKFMANKSPEEQENYKAMFDKVGDRPKSDLQDNTKDNPEKVLSSSEESSSSRGSLHSDKSSE
jgi:hypothetical protein